MNIYFSILNKQEPTSTFWQVHPLNFGMEYVLIVVYKIFRIALINVVQNTPECPACIFVDEMRRMKFCES